MSSFHFDIGGPRSIPVKFSESKRDINTWHAKSNTKLSRLSATVAVYVCCSRSLFVCAVPQLYLRLPAGCLRLVEWRLWYNVLTCERHSVNILKSTADTNPVHAIRSTRVFPSEGSKQRFCAVPLENVECIRVDATRPLTLPCMHHLTQESREGIVCV